MKINKENRSAFMLENYDTTEKIKWKDDLKKAFIIKLQSDYCKNILNQCVQKCAVIIYMKVLNSCIKHCIMLQKIYCVKLTR